MPETIAAIATPPGEGGLHVLRISGPEARELARRIFVPFRGRGRVLETPRRLDYGRIRHPKSGQEIDTGLGVWFPAPHSYTGEEVVELSCHGGTLVSRRVLEAVVDAGARPARPGEFTRRAFVQGKLDLTQAEAVADLIAAASDRALRTALKQLEGRLSQALEGLYQRLLGVLAQLETAIDFPEEGLGFQDKKTLDAEVLAVHAEILSLAETYRQGKILREGLKVVLVGKPNTGKSSLLNALLEEDRAIVTPHPGTTRDVLEERVRLGDLHLTLLDTAGIREHADSIEAEGIKRTRRALEAADLALVLFDGSRPLEAEDHTLIQHLGSLPACLVINKSDLPQVLDPESLPRPPGTFGVQALSATRGTGLSALKDQVYAWATQGWAAPQDLIITRERHRHALLETAGALEKTHQSLQEDRSEDLIAVDLNRALDALGGLLGKRFEADLLDRIFDDFCIGK